jgi:transketolase
MRKQFVKTLQTILYNDVNTTLLLGDIGVFAFRNEFINIPNRVYNIGILEQTMIGVAAGLSKNGLIPFVHTIAPFLVERAYEQLKIDFGYQKLGGNFISVGASYDYAALGCTHHCPADILLMTGIPGMEILIPGNSQELDILLKTTYNNGNPTYTRISEDIHTISLDVEYGKANIIKKGTKATIICYGPLLEAVNEATKNMDVTVLYYSTIMPFDSKTLADNFNDIIIVCEPFYVGSTNYLINSALEHKKYKLHNIGIPRQFLTNYGIRKEHDTNLRLDCEALKERFKLCIA